MAYYCTCPNCGATLDPGEKCNCNGTRVITATIQPPKIVARKHICSTAYKNSEGKCECYKCERQNYCEVKNRYQRLPSYRYPGALGLCMKL